MGEWAWIGKLVEAFGPVGGAFAVVAAVLFFFYRRDHITKQENLKELVRQHTESTDRLTNSMDRMAETSRTNADRVAETARASVDTYTRSLDAILRAFDRRRNP